MTHNEIQKMIYLQGQRDKNFVGSREWIGSIELQSVMKGSLPSFKFCVLQD